MITIDMKMPTDCNSCLIRKIMGCKIANESGWLNNRRDERCLLKEVVRCKDCLYYENEIARMNQTAWLPCMEVKTGGNWYCGSGRKKDG